MSSASSLSIFRGLLEVDLSTLTSLDRTKLLLRLTAAQEALEGVRSSSVASERTKAAEVMAERMLPLCRELAASKEHSDAAALGARMLAEDLSGFDCVPGGPKLLAELAKALVNRSSASKTRSAGIELMRSCFSRWPGEREVDPLGCESVLVRVITQPSKYTPTVIKQANWSLGALCKYDQVTLY